MTSFKLLVSNLPEGNAEGIKEELQELFKSFGNVVNCTFYRNNYAMVEMDNEENSGNALKELNGKLFREKELSVENIKNSGEQQQNIPVIRLALTNVAPSVKSEEIKDLFTKYGLVTACEITDDGSGFVNVEATGDIRTAIKEMNGFVLEDLSMKVEPDVTSNAAKPKSPVKTGNNKSTGSKGTVIKKTYTNKPNRGRAPFGARSRGRGRMPIIRQFYEDEDLSTLSNLGNNYDYDDSYYGEMDMDGDFYQSDSMMGGPFMPPRPGMSFRPSMQDPSFFPRRGSRGAPPGRVLRAPGQGPQRLLGPRLGMHMGPEQGPGAFQGFRGRGVSPGRGSGAGNPFGRGSMRGSMAGRGMMRGRGVFRGGPNGRGFPPAYYSQEEEFYEDEMPQEYLNPGNEIPVRIPRYAPYQGSRNYPQLRGNGPPPYFGGYEEEPMEEEYYEEEFYEDYYEDEPIVPPPYLGSGGGYRDSMSQDFSNGPSQSFPRQRPANAVSKRGQFNNQPQQRQNAGGERTSKKRPIAPGEPYPPPPLRPTGSFVPPKKKFKGKNSPAGPPQKKGNPSGPMMGMGNKKKNANKKNLNGNSVPIGGGVRGGRPQPMMQSRPALNMNQQMYRPPAPRAPGAPGGMPRFGMRPQMQQQPRKSQNANMNPGGNRPRLSTPKNTPRPKMIDFTADIDIN